ncbi:c-type cytochrome [Stutzerimonas frequens]|uniref:c-type cytochrome n=1 Tax=Stutzerimonas frequens TaxID=2968969 RepID=UPI0007BA1308|nr:cytochrome c [Stutzerimonas frequens]MAL92705.1 cytochrome C [Pseudomonas sp.]MEC7472975.1 cytochrome c [Pseudomonadota bacterium]NCT79575.1 cytochrome c [Stutzerimonas stutzeri]KZX57657.1 cytochrome C [Stutzerimonas frequens]MBA4725547.1 cytochrome c [Pseudomonas sp.]|tara:strand:- start:2788 stop:3240 length:453 start_codon:yes stop_codon:yes gene_type:complete
MTGAVAAVLLASTASQAQMKPEEMVETRQAGYQFMSWNMGKIKAQVVDGKEPYDQAKVAAAANAIAAIANSGMGSLYSPDTTTEQLGKATRLKPEFFQNLDEAGQIGRKFTAAANQLAKVAAEGDQAAIKKAFGDVGGSCKSCHDKFRAD